MRIPRRNLLQLAAGAAALALPHAARAQAYPSRPVRIIVAVPPGGPIDMSARLIGQWLAERLGQPFVVENRAGAAGNIGTEAVVRAPADGYTLLLAFAASAINAALFENLNYNFIRDIAPVASINHIPLIMEAHPAFPVRTVAELLAYAKASPKPLDYISPGTRTQGNLFAEGVALREKFRITHIPYKGAGPALVDLVAGHVPFGSVTFSSAAELVRAVYDAPALLLEFPHRGRPGKKAGTRELVISALPDLIVYTVRGDVVCVVRILHGAQQWP